MSTESAIAVARLIAELKNVEGRKRLQKIVHLLGASRVPAFRHRFILHYFGPFSRELAAELDFLVSAHLVAESPPDCDGGSYRYSIPRTAAEQVERLYGDEFELPAWVGFAKELNEASTPQLEAMSTLVFLANPDRKVAVRDLESEFRRIKPNLANEFFSAKQRATELGLLGSPEKTVN